MSGRDNSPDQSAGSLKIHGEDVDHSLPDTNGMEHCEISPVTRNSSVGAQTKNKEVQSVPTPTLSLFPKKARQGSYPVIFNETLGEMIAHMVSQGVTLTQIQDMPGMPTILQIKEFQKSHAQFKDKMKSAYQARAEYLADTAAQIASQSKFATERSDRLKIETAKWLASSHDPNTYAEKKDNHTGGGASLTVIVNTGISSQPMKTVEIETRDPSEVFKEEDERKKLEGNIDRIQAETTPAEPPRED